MIDVPMFHPSLASVTTPQTHNESRVSKSIVNVHWDEIPPEDLASFSCLNVDSSLPATASISTVLTTAGS